MAFHSRCLRLDRTPAYIVGLATALLRGVAKHNAYDDRRGDNRTEGTERYSAGGRIDRAVSPSPGAMRKGAEWIFE